jgi:hypothetical protein
MLNLTPSRNIRQNDEKTTDDKQTNKQTTNHISLSGVKSSIGKLPTYTVTEQVSYTDHPYELPPSEDPETQVLIDLLINK